MPVLDLFKRSESGAALTLTQFDANYTMIEDAVNVRVETDDPRLSDARAPTAHTHLNADLTELSGALAAKASQAALAALQSQVDLLEIGSGFVATGDPRLSDARPIANGSYTLFSVTGGAAALAVDTVGPSNLADGGYGVVTFAGTTFSFNGRVINPAQMANGDHGAFTYVTGVATLNAGVVTLAMLANADFGPFTKAAGVITLDSGVVALANLADGDYGMISKVSGSFVIDAGVVTPSMMANADFGAITFASGIASLDNGVVAPLKLADGDFGLFTMTTGVGTINEVTSATQYIAGASNKPVTANLLQTVYKPRIITPVAGAVGFDANAGLFVVIPEGANNLVHDATPWDNLPLDKEIDVWIKSGASARTNTWTDGTSNLILPTSSLAPYNQTNVWKRFVYRWMPDPASVTTKYRRVVIFGGLFA